MKIEVMSESLKPGKYAVLICNHFYITKDQLKDKSRKYAEARKWFYYICKINGISENRIARYIKRDRSTINDVFNRINSRVDRFKSLSTVRHKILSEV